MARYYRVDAAQRAGKWIEWNKPVYWPIGLAALGLLALVWRIRSSFRERERATGRAGAAPARPAGEGA